MRAPEGGPDIVGPAGVDNLVHHTADLIERLRVRQPRVHCITNAVAQNFTANLLLAAGAVPSMTIARAEVAAFASRADALLVNLGTFDPERRAAADMAIVEIRAASRPFVFDPVLIDRSPPRAAYARGLLSHRPTAIRMNAAEFTALSGEGSPQAFAKQQHTIVAITGETDVVTDGERTFSISNGHPLMARVTAMGCAESALVAAAVAVQPDALMAGGAALLMIGIGGDIAGEAANGPGSFGVHFLDALFNLDPATILERAKVSS